MKKRGSTDERCFKFKVVIARAAVPQYGTMWKRSFTRTHSQTLANSPGKYVGSSWINHRSAALWSPFSANENFTCSIVEAPMTTSCFRAFKTLPLSPVFHFSTTVVYFLLRCFPVCSRGSCLSLRISLFPDVPPTFTINRIVLWLTRRG